MSASSSLVLAVVRCQCPTCRKGSLFVQKSIFPLKHLLKMNEYCTECGQKFKGESNNGPGINYALTTIILFLNAAWYYPIFGMSYKDNSFFYFLATSILVVLLLQPLLMRLSRAIYLYLVLKIKG
jgi:uncharacterized protein (DUF983 family)